MDSKNVRLLWLNISLRNVIILSIVLAVIQSKNYKSVIINYIFG